jgi:hypothetical protein
LTLADDIAGDRALFVDADEFGVTVSYRVASTDTTTAGVPAHYEDVGDSPLDDGAKFWIPDTDVSSPVKGDEITHDGKVYTVEFAAYEQGIWLLTCAEEELIT